MSKLQYIYTEKCELKAFPEKVNSGKKSFNKQYLSLSWIDRNCLKRFAAIAASAAAVAALILHSIQNVSSFFLWIWWVFLFESNQRRVDFHQNLTLSMCSIYTVASATTSKTQHSTMYFWQSIMLNVLYHLFCIKEIWRNKERRDFLFTVMLMHLCAVLFEIHKNSKQWTVNINDKSNLIFSTKKTVQLTNSCIMYLTVKWTDEYKIWEKVLRVTDSASDHTKINSNVINHQNWALL